MFIVLMFSRPITWRPYVQSFGRRGWSFQWLFFGVDIFTESWDDFRYAMFGSGVEDLPDDYH